MLEAGFDSFSFQKFINDTKAVLATPANYFSSMVMEGGYLEPLSKAVIYGFISALISFIWGILHLGSAGNFGFFGPSFGVYQIVMYIILFIAGLFIGGAIILVISVICGGNSDYEANVRVMASLMAISPVYEFLDFLAFLSFFSQLIKLCVIFYGLWMLYNALIKALDGQKKTALIILLVISVIPVLLFLSTIDFPNRKARFDQRMNNLPVEYEQMNKENPEKGKEDIIRNE